MYVVCLSQYYSDDLSDLIDIIVLARSADSAVRKATKILLTDILKIKDVYRTYEDGGIDVICLGISMNINVRVDFEGCY